MTKPLSKPNMLTHVQVMQVTRAMLGMAKELVQEQPSLLSLADRLSRELGFKVTASNVFSQCKAEVVEGYAPAKNKDRAGRHSEPVRLALESIERQGRKQAELEARITKLERQLMALQTDLDVPAAI